jgi:hypothetical protein
MAALRLLWWRYWMIALGSLLLVELLGEGWCSGDCYR